MKNFCSLFVFMTMIFFGCENSEIPRKPYTLEFDEGIYFEKFDSSYTDDSRYSINNEIYKPGRVFVFDYFYISPEKDTFLMNQNPDRDALYYHKWSFIPLLAQDTSKVEKLILSIEYGKGFVEDYKQTVIKYDYLNRNGNSAGYEKTGVVENEKNIWMHPPRFEMFKILELNPFPFIMAPYRSGTSYTWKLEIGESWGDRRWKEWTGNIINKVNYIISDREKLETSIGELECLKIASKAESELGTTFLTSFFNEKYGFVKLDYTNIDGSKLIMSLTQVVD